MASYEVDDAQTQFDHLLDLVLQGETVVITRDGVPVAELKPLRKPQFPLDTGLSPEALQGDEEGRY